MRTVNFSSHLLLISVLACAITFTSCTKFTDVPAPQNDLIAQQVFSSDYNATRTMIGVYTSIMDNKWSLLNGGLSVFCGLSADELTRTQPFLLEDAFAANTLTGQNAYCSIFYTAGYNWIYQCNSIIENLHLSKRVDDSTARQLTGEAKFVRALVYFYLVNLYGDVPLITSPDFRVTATVPRSAIAWVYQQIISDLLDAQTLLPIYYPGEGEYSRDRSRPNQATATALLARVYCYMGNWSDAGKAAGRLIDDPRFTLASDLENVFQKTSAEVIWQLQPVHENISTAEGSLFIPRSGATPTYAMTDWLLNSFEPGDQRLTHWTSSGNQRVFPYKYRQASDQPAGVEYNVLLRLSEQYLIRAEARIMLNDSTGAAADLNLIRQRAGLGKITPDGHTDILHAIWHERQVELFAECGHRWLDLRRTRQIDPVLGAEKTGWQPYKALYPIPSSQLEKNPNLVQNPGY